ncbi:MAG: competence/damage-inducible protein A [Candidatus Omnitrophica bacterium]|nr:competence/damage-inducible protein A [Candidatus Omnitrophota bacterium]
MNAEIIACGTELLLGQNINTNATYISNSLSRIGLDVFRHLTVGDNKERFSSAIKEALSRSNIVITTGGLGPTVDDITMGTLASVIKKDLVFNKKIYKYIKDSFKKSAFKVPKDAIKQALIPRGADWIENKVGTAPGLIIKHEKKYLIALPGPPRELNPMFEKDIIPFLKKIQPQKWIIKSRSLRLIGLPEAKVNEKVKDLLELSGHTTLGIYTHLGQVELKITSKAHSEKSADSNIKKLEGRIRKRVKDLIYGANKETLQEAVGNILAKKKKRLAVAESCTGGLISNLMTDVSGSSKYFVTGVVAYSNEIKVNRLNVPKELIKKHGAVSKEVAKSMADNIRALANADIGIGVTGIAGPTGQTKKKPIGLVYIALSTKSKKIVKEFRFQGKREEVKLQAAQQALNLLRLNI